MHVVNIMPHGPTYDYADGAPPDVSWTTGRGTSVGFWTREWPDQLGEAVLQRGADIRWEVWQPDARADQVYTSTRPSGLVHRLFPATRRRFRREDGGEHGLHSDALTSALEALTPDARIVFHGFRVPCFAELLRRFAPRRPVAVIGHGMCTTPITEMNGWHRPLTYYRLLLEQRALRAALASVELITAQSDYAASEVRKVYDGRIERLTMGCDFEFWRPSADAKPAVRRRLDLPLDRLVLLSTGNFVPFKRFDRLVRTLEGLPESRRPFLLIAGQGTDEARRQLAESMTRLTSRGHARLSPYVTGAALRDLYWAADCYVSRSVSEGSSVAVMKAMACGLPVITPPVGETAERMARHGIGLLLPDNDSAWATALGKLTRGSLPPAFDREAARGAYDWPLIAERCIGLLRSLRPAGARAQVAAGAYA